MTAREASHTAWRTLTTAGAGAYSGAMGACELTPRTIGRTARELTLPLLRSTHGPPRPCAEYRRVQAVSRVREACRDHRRLRARAGARERRRAARALRCAARARARRRVTRRPAAGDVRGRARGGQADDGH